VNFWVLIEKIVSLNISFYQKIKQLNRIYFSSLFFDQEKGYSIIAIFFCSSIFLALAVFFQKKTCPMGQVF
jgi:hypothetical protein